jgi:hypothetical protein
MVRVGATVQLKAGRDERRLTLGGHALVMMPAKLASAAHAAA